MVTQNKVPTLLNEYIRFVTALDLIKSLKHIK